MGSTAIACATVVLAGACVGPDVSLGVPIGSASHSGSGGTESADDEVGDPSTGLEPGACGLAEPAFCETFEVRHPGGRGGDLDESRWSFARWAHAVQYFWLRFPASTDPDSLFPPSFCGGPFSGVLPGDDVRACEGVGVDGSPSLQLNEVFDDQGGFAMHSMRIRQPFDFTDRTGTLVWDVDAKVNPYNVGHGWWIELWITEDPTPLPHDEFDNVFTVPRRGIGFLFRFGADCPNDAESWGNALETVIVTQDYEISGFFDDVGWENPESRCFRSMDARLNHFELTLSQDRAELEVTHFDDPTGPRARAVVEGLALPWSRGYVHFQHAHFNASLDGIEGCEAGVPGTCPTSSQTFRWDNIGFDGAVLPTPRGYDVPDPLLPGPEGGVYVGWPLGDGQTQTLELTAVDPRGAVRAVLNLNVFAGGGQTLEVRFNAGPWHASAIPGADGTPYLRSHSIEVPIEDLVMGTNALEVRLADAQHGYEGMGNIDLTVETAP